MTTTANEQENSYFNGLNLKRNGQVTYEGFHKAGKTHFLWRMEHGGSAYYFQLYFTHLKFQLPTYYGS